MGSGKNGYIFTDSKVYYLETLEKPNKLWYEDICRISIIDKEKTNDCDRKIKFELYDGTNIIWDSIFLNKTPLLKFFTELLLMDNKNIKQKSVEKLNYNSKIGYGSISGGIGSANYHTVNKLFDEEKFHANQGHGYAAERANNLFDNVRGHDAKIVGDNNIKNGADRILDGIQIQSKYCATGSRCINACFTEEGKGTFRYYCKDGKPMQIEVPSDDRIYNGAIEAMKDKIRKGRINGVSNPEEAKNIVKKGNFTYQQAKNIAKAGNVESITYDAVSGVVAASSALGVSAMLTFATSIWNGEEPKVALKLATYSGIKVGGTAFLTSIIASQLSKAGLNSALVASSEAIVGIMGPKASAILVNAFRNGSKIYGAAAMKSAAKLLRGNVITAGVTVIVLSSFDIVNIFKGRISGKQLFKNLTNTVTTVASGTAGWMGGAAIGSAVLPGVGTVVGGIIGSIGAGAIAGKATDTVVGSFIEDDADEMVEIIQKEFEKLAIDYLLNQKEAEKIIDKLKDKLDGEKLKNMFVSDNKEEFATKLLLPLIEREIKNRTLISVPSNTEINDGIKEVLEEIYDRQELISKFVYLISKRQEDISK